jgi:hypothetical protein
MAEASSPSLFDPRLARVVKIKIADETGEAVIGTGYLVAPGLVLTARHVLWRDGKEDNGDYPDETLRVRAATGLNAGSSLRVSKVIRLGEALGVDVAVLVVPGLEPVAGTVVVGARFTTSQPVAGCWMIGYPKAAHQDGNLGAEYVGVSVIPVSGSAAGRIAVQVTTPPAREDADWRGLSGAGLVDVQDRLVGVLVSVQVQWDERLSVVPVQALIEAANQRLDEDPELGTIADLVVAEEDSAVFAERAGISVFDRSKFPPRLTDLRRQSLFNALQFKNRTVPFIDDDTSGPLVKGMLAWVRATEAAPDLKVSVVTGPGGVGKSRLAAEVCDRLAAAAPWWQAGFADHDKLLAAPVPTTPTVIVVDYPERHPEIVGGFLTLIHEHQSAGLLQAPVRVILVSRDEQSWSKRMREVCTDLDTLIDHRAALTLKQFSIVPQILHAAVASAAFGEGFGIPNAARPRIAVGGNAEMNRPLLVHAAAVLASWRHVQPDIAQAPVNAGPLVTNQGRLLDDLINAEIKRLLRMRYGDGTGLGAPVFANSDQVREALCVITLTAPARDHLPKLLACTEAFGEHGSQNRVMAADALVQCYPMRATLDDGTVQWSVAPVEPDLIAAHLLHTTPGRSGLVGRLITSDAVAANPRYRARLIGALALAAKDYRDIGADLRAHLADSLADLIDATAAGHDSLAVLLADHLGSLVAAAVAAASAQDLTPARQLAAALDLPAGGRHQHIDRAAADVYRKLPYPHPGLAGLGVALSRHALAHAERSGKPDLIATATATHGVWLSDYGQRVEALVAAQRSTGLYEELAVGNRAAHLPDLATSVNNLANHLAAAGRREEALTTAQRAVDLREELAADNPAAYLPDLATSVNNLAIRLGEAGRREEGLAAAQQAVDLREELAADNPAAYLPDLATSVNNLAIRLAEVGRREEALTTAQRAVKLREELAADNRAAHLPDVAMSVNNLANRLAEVGRREEALTTAQRAVDLREELAADNRAAYLPALAGNVNNLANHLAAAGRREEGLAAAQRAVDLREELAADNRAAHLPALATSVNNLAIRLGEAGRREEGLAAAQRAVDLYEELAAGNRAAYLPDLATSVNNLAVDLAAAGRREEALTTAQRAVDLYEELAAGNRAAHLPDLAGSYWTAAYVRYVFGVELQDGLAWCDKSIVLFRELAAAEPGAFAEKLAAVEELRAKLKARLDGDGTAD